MRFLPEQQDSQWTIGLVRVDAAHGNSPEIVWKKFRKIVLAGHVRISDDGRDVVVNEISENGIRENEDRDERRQKRRDAMNSTLASTVVNVDEWIEDIWWTLKIIFR